MFHAMERIEVWEWLLDLCSRYSLVFRPAKNWGAELNLVSSGGNLRISTGRDKYFRHLCSKKLVENGNGEWYHGGRGETNRPLEGQ